MKERTIIYDQKLKSIDTNIFWQSQVTNEGHYEGLAFAVPKLTPKQFEAVLRNTDHPHREFLMEYFDKKILTWSTFTTCPDDIDADSKDITLPSESYVYMKGIRAEDKKHVIVRPFMSVCTRELAKDGFDYLFACFTKRKRKLGTIGFEKHGTVPEKGWSIVGISLHHPNILKLEPPQINREFTELIN